MQQQREQAAAAASSGSGEEDGAAAAAARPSKPLPRAEIELAPPAAPASQPAHPFRVCTFNVLADGLAQSGDFVKVPISCLQWEHRLPLILAELRAADADIVCLQELNHFDVLAAHLMPLGYSCFFRAKNPSPATKFGFPADGIALFYRHARFAPGPAPPEGRCFESMDGQPAAQGYVAASLRDRRSGRLLLVAATHLKAKAGAENELTRVHQAAQLLLDLEGLARRAAAAGEAPPAVLLCGDLNTTPDSETVASIRAHKLGLRSLWDVQWGAGALAAAAGGSTAAGAAAAAAVAGARAGAAGAAAVPTNGNGNGKHHNGNGNGNGNGKHHSSSNGNGNGKHADGGNGTSAAAAAAAVPAGAGAAAAGSAAGEPGLAAAAAAAGEAAAAAAHSSSAPAAAAADASPPPPLPAQPGSEFTTFKFRSSGAAKRTIDYVWFSGGALAPLSRWRMLSEGEIGARGLPNEAYPSDHVAVAATLGWLDAEQEEGAGEQQQQQQQQQQRQQQQ